jgi:FAD binding domain
MTTHQAEPAAPPRELAAPPRELAAALRAAGLTGVDDSVRRRAEYSSDASNYRVVPTVVAFPRHVDEAAAALSVARRLGVPVTCRGGGTSIAGNAVGAGLVLDFSRHLNRVLAIDPQARTAVVEPGAILDDITAAAAGHGLRFGSFHPRAGQHRRFDREQRLRLAGAAVRPYRRQRGEPGGADRLGGAAGGAAFRP